MNKIVFDPNQATEIELNSHYEACYRGSLRHLLHKGQRKVYDRFFHPESWDIGILASRGYGKTLTGCVIAITFALRNPNTRTMHVFPSMKQASDSAGAVYRMLSSSLPANIRPKFNKQEATLHFKNGARICLRGVHQNNIERLRGGRTHAVVADEIGFWSEDTFIDAWRNCLLAQFVGATNHPKTLFLTTPPYHKDHPFLTEVLPLAVKDNSFFQMTYEDNPFVDSRLMNKFIGIYGKDSIGFRREYMAELVFDSAFTLVPEFNQARHVSSEKVENPPRDSNGLPVSSLTVLGVDTGGSIDNTAFVGGFIDRNTNKFIVTAEHILNDRTLGRPHTLADVASQVTEIRTSELNKFGNEGFTSIDCTPLVASSLRQEYNLEFNRPKVRKVVDNIEFLREHFASDRVVINPDCTNLIETLENALWDEDKTGIARSKQYAHGDVIMALIYALREVQYIWDSAPGSNKELNKLSNRRIDNANISKRLAGIFRT